MQVFVDAFPHIPQHRRLPLFDKLITTLGSDRFLWLMMLLLVNGHVIRRERKTSEGDKVSPINYGRDLFVKRLDRDVFSNYSFLRVLHFFE